MAKIYMNKPFSRFAAKNGIDHRTLCKAIREIENGRMDADLGRGLYKQRIARRGEGKSGGFRTIIAFRHGNNAVFIHGFAKNDQANLNAAELKALRQAAREYLSMSKFELMHAVQNGKLFQVVSDEKTIP